MENTMIFSLFQKRQFLEKTNFRYNKYTFWTSFLAPRDVKNPIKTCCFLNILFLQQDQILDGF